MTKILNLLTIALFAAAAVVALMVWELPDPSVFSGRADRVARRPVHALDEHSSLGTLDDNSVP